MQLLLHLLGKTPVSILVFKILNNVGTIGELHSRRKAALITSSPAALFVFKQASCLFTKSSVKIGIAKVVSAGTLLVTNSDCRAGIT